MVLPSECSSLPIAGSLVRLEEQSLPGYNRVKHQLQQPQLHQFHSTVVVMQANDPHASIYTRACRPPAELAP